MCNFSRGLLEGPDGEHSMNFFKLDKLFKDIFRSGMVWKPFVQFMWKAF